MNDYGRNALDQLKEEVRKLRSDVDELKTKVAALDTYTKDSQELAQKSVDLANRSFTHVNIVTGVVLGVAGIIAAIGVVSSVLGVSSSQDAQDAAEKAPEKAVTEVAHFVATRVPEAVATEAREAASTAQIVATTVAQVQEEVATVGQVATETLAAQVVRTSFFSGTPQTPGVISKTETQEALIQNEIATQAANVTQTQVALEATQTQEAYETTCQIRIVVPLNVHIEPSMNADVLGEIPSESIWSVVGRNSVNTWWNICYGGQSGWVSNNTEEDTYVERLGNCSDTNVPDTSPLSETGQPVSCTSND